MKNIFFLAVAVGSILHNKDGQRKLTDVPADAKELWEAGAYWLGLKSGQADFLKQYDKKQLQKILDLRKAHNYAAEIEQLEAAIQGTDDGVKAFLPKTPETVVDDKPNKS